MKNLENLEKLVPLDQVNKQVIEAWKQEYESIWKLTIDMEGEGEDKICYVRNPNRKEMSYASRLATQDPMKFNEHLLMSCMLSGDHDIIKKDSLFMSACAQLEKILNIRTSKLEKL